MIVLYKARLGLIALFPMLIALVACNPAADSVETAKGYLLAAPDWGIEEVYVNEALSYKDGKKIENFGGVAFNRYMQSVQFKEDGSFVGKYTEQEKPNVLHWKVLPQEKIIIVTAAPDSANPKPDPRSGWTIVPQNVHEDSFEMTTETAAFSYPRVMKIRLVFRRK